MLGTRRPQRRFLFVALSAATLGLACANSPGEDGNARDTGVDDTPFTRRARDSEVYRSLDYLRREAGEDAVAERIRTLPGDYPSVQSAAMWLHDQFFGSTSPRPQDGLWYFDALLYLYDAPVTTDPSIEPGSHLRGIGGLAVAAWVSSQLLALEDHARCEDRTGGLVYLQNWQRDRRESVERVWEALDPRDRAAVLRTAQRHTGEASTRPPDPRPCASGITAMGAAIDAGRCIERPTPANADEYVGGRDASFFHCDAEEFVRFVDDETWRARLPALRERYWDRLFAPAAVKDATRPTP